MGITSICCFFNYSVLRKVDHSDGLVAGCGSLAMLGTGEAAQWVTLWTFRGDAEDRTAGEAGS